LDVTEPTALPAFLTNPVRAPISSDVDETPAPAPAPKAAEAVELEARPRRRAVRRPRVEESDNGEPNDTVGNKAETPAE
jgi:hypothetical protein